MLLRLGRAPPAVRTFDPALLFLIVVLVLTFLAASMVAEVAAAAETAPSSAVSPPPARAKAVADEILEKAVGGADPNPNLVTPSQAATGGGRGEDQGEASPSPDQEAQEEGVGAAKRQRQMPPLASAVGPGKRRDYLEWDDYFMAVAFLSAMRSKDPSTQVGAW